MNTSKYVKAIFFFIENSPTPTHEEYLQKLHIYKNIVDRTPDKWLQFHLDNAIKDEWFELAAYIRDTMKNRTDPIYPLETLNSKL